MQAIPEESRAASAALIEGVELTLRELTNVMTKHGVTPISPAVGDMFDPQLHQAMFEAPLPGTKAGQIIQVMTEGFLLHDRLLRPAQVGVSSNTQADRGARAAIAPLPSDQQTLAVHRSASAPPSGVSSSGWMSFSRSSTAEAFWFGAGGGGGAARNSGRSSISVACLPPSRSPFSSASSTTLARSITLCGRPASRATCTP